MSDLVQIYQWISIIGYICAGLFFLIAVFLFFFLDIWQVIGYLTKRTEKRAIEAIRSENEKKKENTLQESSGVKRIIQTDKISTEKLVQDAKISMMETNETTLLEETGETTLLQETGETTVLQESGETTLLDSVNEPELYRENMIGQTTELEKNDEYNRIQHAEMAQVVFLEEIIYVHTKERI